jgi:hypothetical protein
MSRPSLVQRFGRPFGVALLTASLLGAVQATTFSTLTLVQQAKKAEVIVQAVIGTPSTVTEGGQSYAVYPLKVSETLAGDASQLPQVGGGPALYVLSGMDQAPVFQAGQDAVLLLYKGRLDSPLVGFNQGAYLVSSGQVSVLPVAGAPLPQIQPEVPQQGATPDGTVQPGNGPAAAPTTPPATTPPATTPAGGTVTPPQPPGGTSTPPAAPQTGNGIGAPDTTGGAGNTAGTAPGGNVTPPTPPQGQGTAPATTPPATTPPINPTTATPPATSGATPAAPGTTPPVSPTTPPAPTAAPTPAATPAPPPGVLGSIRTAVQLKAAIVAARAAK